MANTYEVKLLKGGSPIVIKVQAQNQDEAKKIAEHQYPGYKYSSSRTC